MREELPVVRGQVGEIFLPRTVFSREVPLLVDAKYDYVACGKCKGICFSPGALFDCLDGCSYGIVIHISIWSKLPNASLTSLSAMSSIARVFFPCCSGNLLETTTVHRQLFQFVQRNEGGGPLTSPCLAPGTLRIKISIKLVIA